MINREIDNNKVQLYISALLGDGCIIRTRHNNGNTALQFSSINRGYMQFKKSLVGGSNTSDIIEKDNSSGSFTTKNNIYTLRVGADEVYTYLDTLSLTELVDMMDELGFAMWVYDDGALHKKNMFYNIYSNSFSEDDVNNILIPKVREFGCKPQLFLDRKKNGKEYPYIYISKNNGSDIISNILRKYSVEGMLYKHWDYEYTDRFQELKRDNPRFSTNKLSMALTREGIVAKPQEARVK